MTIEQGAALVGLAITALGGLAWLGTLTWHAGKSSQRLDNAVTDIERLKELSEQHGASIAAWSQALDLLKEVRHDVKNLMMGRPAPGKRNGTGD